MQPFHWNADDTTKFILDNTGKEQESDLAKGTKQEICSVTAEHIY